MSNDRELCPRYEAATELLGKKWTGLIVWTLLDGPKRFSEVRELVPELSDRLLSERLKELEDAGVVARHVYDQRPVLVQYELTEKGRQLKQVVDAIQDWANKWF